MINYKEAAEAFVEDLKQTDEWLTSPGQAALVLKWLFAFADFLANADLTRYTPESFDV